MRWHIGFCDATCKELETRSRPAVSVWHLMYAQMKFDRHIYLDSAQCLTDISPKDRREIEDGILRARELNSGLFEREMETYVFNVSFNAVYTNETREGGFIS